jgi:hypothetical protein
MDGFGHAGQRCSAAADGGSADDELSKTKQPPKFPSAAVVENFLFAQ